MKSPERSQRTAPGPSPATATRHGPEAKADGAGPYYRTTLCVLMLEVFYRYMPINK